MAQTEAQRRASEANLKKGNKAAYTKQKDEPAATPPPDPGKRTVRAKAPPPAKKPAKKPAKAPEPSPDPPRKSGGFLSGLFDGLSG